MIPERIPADLNTQAALYRSLLAGRRVLVVLDNARDSDHASQLLPGTPGCLAVITSRNQLTGLVAGQGAHPLTLDVLEPAEAHELVARRIGAERVAAEPAALRELVVLCARLPLTLAIATARAAAHPTFPLADIVAELREARGSLDAFADVDGQRDVRAIFSWSYRVLTPAAARLFRLLALHPGPDVSAAAAASVAGLPLRQTRPLLAELTRAHLLAERSAGRFTWHDLLRAYASELINAEDSESSRDQATYRIFDHYLHTAYRAAVLFSPLRDEIPLVEPVAGVIAEQIADQDRASSWFTTEHSVLLAVLGSAATAGFDPHTWRLAWTMEHFLDRRGYWHDLVTTQRTALQAAHRLGDLAGQGYAHRGLARALADLSRFDEACVQMERALALFTEAGNDTERAHTHRLYSWVLERQGNNLDALGHAQKGLDLQRIFGNVGGQAAALNAVGWYHGLLGDHRHALDCCQEALVLFEQLGDRYGLADTWHSVGYAQQHLGDHAEAAASYLRARDYYHGLGVRYGEADALECLGETYAVLGNVESARVALTQAVAILDELDHPDAERARDKLHNLDLPQTLRSSAG
ncbi:MAG TPA: tetratricopeptide repeat protein [Pseudonocardiaceae bacterium]|nr:tetratricopeptide repeat protein [Pseudonocardiaceae bacterium]